MTEHNKGCCCGVCVGKLRAELIAKDKFWLEKFDGLKKSQRSLCDDRKRFLDERNRLKSENEIMRDKLEHFEAPDCEICITKWNREIQSLTAKLADAREGNRNLSALLGKAQKRASENCAVKFKNQNKHLREQLKKITKRYEELKNGL